MTDELQVVVLRIMDEGGVIGRVIVRSQPGSAVFLGSSGKGRSVEGVHAAPRRHTEGEVYRRRWFAAPDERKRCVFCRAQAGSLVPEVAHEPIAERRENSKVELAAARDVAHRDIDVVELDPAVVVR